MRSLRRLFALGLFLTLAASASDISGAWDLKVTTPQGDLHTAKLTLTQEGEKISGLLSGERGEFKIDGTCKGDQIELVVNYTGGDAPRRIPFRGKLDDAGKMSGRYTAGDDDGDWSATRAK